MRASWRPLWPQWRLALKSPWLSIAIFQDDKVHWDKHVHGTSKVKNPFRECPRTHRWQADLFGLPKHGWFIEEYKPDSWGQWSETWYRNDGCARLQEISKYYWNIHHYYMDYISEIQLVLAEMKHTRVIELWPLRPDITLLMSALVNIPASSWKGLWRYPEMSCEEEGGGIWDAEKMGTWSWHGYVGQRIGMVLWWCVEPSNEERERWRVWCKVQVHLSL